MLPLQTVLPNRQTYKSKLYFTDPKPPFAFSIQLIPFVWLSVDVISSFKFKFSLLCIKHAFIAFASFSYRHRL